MKYKFTLQVLALALLLFAIHPYFACKKIDLEREVLVISQQAQDITYNSARLHGQLVDIGEAGSIVEYGFVYGNTSLPTLENDKAVATASLQQGNYSVLVGGLESNTQYYFRAYALEQNNKVSYGNAQSLLTGINPDASIPELSTLEISNITPYSALVKGSVDDDGGAPIFRRGFCISTNPQPTISNDTISESSTSIGNYELNFTNLEPETEYYVRAYARNQLGIGYGEELSFTSLEAGEPVNEWLHYDNGINYDGIGLTNGGSFDVAIRFSSEQLAPYNGMKITKVKFYPKSIAPTEYYIEILTGPDPTLEDLEYEQWVENPLIDEWNEISLDTLYSIDASKDLWVGYYIDGHPVGEFPAGIDEGPGERGYGDMISVEALGSWGSLYEVGFDANWNIQVFVSNQNGEEIPMTRPRQHETMRQQEKQQKPASLSSSKKTSNKADFYK